MMMFLLPLFGSDCPCMTTAQQCLCLQSRKRLDNLPYSFRREEWIMKPIVAQEADNKGGTNKTISLIVGFVFGGGRDKQYALHPSTGEHIPLRVYDAKRCIYIYGHDWTDLNKWYVPDYGLEEERSMHILEEAVRKQKRRQKYQSETAPAREQLHMNWKEWKEQTPPGVCIGFFHCGVCPSRGTSRICMYRHVRKEQYQRLQNVKQNTMSMLMNSDKRKR
jgi:hypothetical protein